MNKSNRSAKHLIICGTACFVGATSLAAAIGLGVGIGIGRADNQPASTPLVLKADTANRGKSISLATGLVDSEEATEGLFVLDHLTGDLQCWVMNSRTGGVSAVFKANVTAPNALGIDKAGDADYVMATGGIDFERGGVSGNAKPARVICYVADGNSGKVVGYGLVYNRQQALKGNTQGGALQIVCRGLARGGQLIRDN